jgi:hypothetical protein
MSVKKKGKSTSPNAERKEAVGVSADIRAALDERTHPCTMTAVSPYTENQLIFFIG